MVPPLALNVGVTAREAPSLHAPVTVNCFVAPVCKDAELGESVIDVSVGVSAMTVAVPL
jgi:hypothetical protein